MQCDYFDTGACRSCTWMGQPYARQLEQSQGEVESVLADAVPLGRWLAPAYGPESGFRNKAKLAVGGTRAAPTFGILDGARRGVDLRDCGLYEPGLHDTVLRVADFITALGLTPYDVPRRTGELKHVVVTQSPDEEAMIRFVLRSPGQLPRLARAVPDLLAHVPAARVVSVNLLPEHRAVQSGTEEVLLTSQASLPMRVGAVTLFLRPGSFFQTNTEVARQLYAQAREWISDIRPASVLDLFCGVGGFALHAAGTPNAHPESIHGVEIADESVRSAQLGAAALAGSDRLGDIRFTTGDAADALGTRGSGAADLVIVNPPRRGIGELAAGLERSPATQVLYSSCNAATLAADLRAMPSFGVERARMFDMFPQTRHREVLLLLGR